MLSYLRSWTLKYHENERKAKWKNHFCLSESNFIGDCKISLLPNLGIAGPTTGAPKEYEYFHNLKRK